MGDKFTLSLTILLTGFAVVFVVLLVLIGIIKAYGTVFYNIQNKKREEKAARNADLPKVEREELPAAPAEDEPARQADDDELIAVITAAVYSACNTSDVRIKSIRRFPARVSAWRNVGLSDNVRPF